MYHAFTDASTRSGVGGWGVVLTGPAGTTRYAGRFRMTDNTAAELRAVLEAVRRAPRGVALTVHTDASGLTTIVPRGSRNEHLNDLARQVRAAAHARGIRLAVVHCPRERKHLRTAHDLANDGRLQRRRRKSERARVTVRIKPPLLGRDYTLLVRRNDSLETLTFHVDPSSSLQADTQALLEVLTHARHGEHVTVHVNAPLTRALFLAPARAKRGEVRAALERARADLAARNVTVEFGD